MLSSFVRKAPRPHQCSIFSTDYSYLHIFPFSVLLPALHTPTPLPLSHFATYPLTLHRQPTLHCCLLPHSTLSSYSFTFTVTFHSSPSYSPNVPGLTTLLSNSHHYFPSHIIHYSHIPLLSRSCTITSTYHSSPSNNPLSPLLYSYGILPIPLFYLPYTSFLLQYFTPPSTSCSPFLSPVLYPP